MSGYIVHECERLLSEYYGAFEREIRDFIKRTKISRLYLYIDTNGPPRFETIQQAHTGSILATLTGYYRVRSTIPANFRPNLPG